MKNLEKYFEKGELIPTIVQEKITGEVLMLAYMNAESLQKTMETGYTWFYSRSSASFQLVCCGNCSTYRSYFSVFMGRGEIHIFLLYHLIPFQPWHS